MQKAVPAKLLWTVLDLAMLSLGCVWAAAVLAQCISLCLPQPPASVGTPQHHSAVIHNFGAEASALQRKRYALPTANELAVIVTDTATGDAATATKHQVVVHKRGGDLQYIHFIPRLYEPLHYVLLFPYGEEGWHPDIRRATLPAAGQHAGEAWLQMKLRLRQLRVRQLRVRLLRLRLRVMGRQTPAPGV